VHVYLSTATIPFGPKCLVDWVLNRIGDHDRPLVVLASFGPTRSTVVTAAPNAAGGRELLRYARELRAEDLVAALLVDVPVDDDSLVAEWARTLLSTLSHGPTLLDVIVVRKDRWWSHLCGDQHCCSAGGQPLRDVGATAGVRRQDPRAVDRVPPKVG
jgi:hypothetical protein